MLHTETTIRAGLSHSERMIWNQPTWVFCVGLWKVRRRSRSHGKWHSWLSFSRLAWRTVEFTQQSSRRLGWLGVGLVRWRCHAFFNHTLPITTSQFPLEPVSLLVEAVVKSRHSVKLFVVYIISASKFFSARPRHRRISVSYPNCN